YVAVKPQKCESFGAPRRRPPAKRKCGDVDAHVAERSSDRAYYAWHIAIASQKQRALERGFEANPIEAQNTRRRILEHSSFRREFFPFTRDRHFNRIRKSVLASSCNFF